MNKFEKFSLSFFVFVLGGGMVGNRGRIFLSSHFWPGPTPVGLSQGKLRAWYFNVGHEKNILSDTLTLVLMGGEG